MKRKKCECGCGEIANPGKRFIVGHSQRCRRVSSETRKKISQATRGKVVSLETRSNISRALMGHTLSEETKKKISKAQIGNKKGLGHIVSDDARKKISDTKRKSDSESSWNKYHPYKALYQYRQLQSSVRERDHHQCVLCNEKKNIQTHHIVPVRVGYKSRLCDHESNIISLCISCHTKVEPRRTYANNKNKWRKFLPFAKKYLSKFSYKEMLLDVYLDRHKILGDRQ